MEQLKAKIEEELRSSNGRIGLAIEIEGESICVNSEEVFQSASLIKLPILIEAFRQSEMGKLNENELVSITNHAGGSGVLQAFSRDALLTIKDLMTLMITVSDNTATNLLIDKLGMETIHRSFEKMGLQHTALNRKMMDFEAIEQGLDNYTSPLDMMTCLRIVKEGDFLAKQSREEALRILSYQQFQDRLPGMMELDMVKVANKTGSLPHIEHDCAVVTNNEKTAYAVVLMDQLDDVFAAKLKISRIGKHIFDYLVEKA
ncbi:class A beta-lactamase-related serine hydrolase [Paenibacillus sp. BSR1-1]|uniref:serine hydrolase n=1 Tax=Paenibacillus sp. BSR1-1 TaxID=3020845 RepID=UPI0025B1D7FC|nr:serine hydrolase [Paenibacillus sp. BSR1-1]MDN3020049.1 class A beta-lactamase-related serine hydrolase [Paenibacillus sp. BSR1-1]